LVSNLGIYFSNFISSQKRQEHMLGALNDTPFVDKTEIFVKSFSLGK
jgi:hypothetical protein